MLAAACVALSMGGCRTSSRPATVAPWPVHAAYCPKEWLEWLAYSPLYELDTPGMSLYPGWHRRVFHAVQVLSWETAEDPIKLRAELDSLFRLDSVALKWSLADLIADEFRYDESTAAIAASAYAAFDFDATSLLARAQVQGTGPQRWRAVLQPLRAPLSAAEERVVVGFVCRAMPLLIQPPP